VADQGIGAVRDDDVVLVDAVTRRQALEQRGAVLRVAMRLRDRLLGRLDRARKGAEVRLVRVEPGDPQTVTGGSIGRRRVGRVREEPRVVEASRRRRLDVSRS
jgi:hypothetical protein